MYVWTSDLMSISYNVHSNFSFVTEIFTLKWTVNVIDLPGMLNDLHSSSLVKRPEQLSLKVLKAADVMWLQNENGNSAFNTNKVREILSNARLSYCYQKKEIILGVPMMMKKETRTKNVSTLWQIITITDKRLKRIM